MMPAATDTERVTVGASGSRWFAAVWKFIDGSVDATLANAKDEILEGVAGNILEIGAGVGSNMSRFAPGSHVVAVEPNQHMHHALASAGAAHGLNLDIRSGGAERLDVPDGSQDFVVSNLVLCSVEDREQVLREIRRALRTGGRFVFIEHVESPAGSWSRRWQAMLRRPWSRIFDGCDIVPSTVRDIEEAGFSSINGRIERFGPAVDPSSITYFGQAVA